MVQIHIGLAGEGRGHAARTRTLIERLRQRHRVTVHTFGDAYAFLYPLYGKEPSRLNHRGGAYSANGPYPVSVRQIPGLQFAYGSRGQLDYLRTTVQGVGSLRALADSTRRLESTLRDEGADLVISDFEPTLPRAARRVGVPVIALDHQSAFSYGDFSALPSHLSRHARLIGRFVRLFTPEPDLQISSSFYVPAIKRARFRRPPVHFIGVLLRDAIRSAVSVRGEHLVAYLRPGSSPSTIDALRQSPTEVRLYGLPEVPSGGAIVSRPVSEAGFVRDLASCRAVVSTAGNQLLGEAIHLGKPVLALPEPGNKEQEINGWFLEQSGAGRVVRCDLFSPGALRGFLAAERQYIHAALRLDVDGTERAVELIESHIRSRPHQRFQRAVPASTAAIA